MTTTSSDRPVVVLHVGTMKSGTTYIQSVFKRNVERLAKDGVLFPAWANQITAGRELRTDTAEKPMWTRLTGKIARWPGPLAVISVETMSFASPGQADYMLDSLAGHEIRVVVTARDMARVLPSTWQTGIRKGATATLEEYAAAVLSDDRSSESAHHFWNRQDLLTIVNRWAAATGSPVEVVTVPPRNADPDELWRRFCRVLRLDPARYDTDDIENPNPSLSAVEAEIMRRINAVLPADLTGSGKNEIRGEFVNRLLRGASDAQPEQLSAQMHERAIAYSRELVRDLASAPIHVTGDLADLIPSPYEAPAERGADVDAAERANTAVRVAAMLMDDLANEESSADRATRAEVRRERRVASRGGGGKRAARRGGADPSGQPPASEEPAEPEDKQARRQRRRAARAAAGEDATATQEARRERRALRRQQADATDAAGVADRTLVDDDRAQRGRREDRAAQPKRAPRSDAEGRSVYLHVGTVKSGTTYIQEVLRRNVDVLREADVKIPSNRLVAAVRDALGVQRSFAKQSGAWAELAASALHDSPRNSIVSMEFLSFATAEQARQIVESFEGADVHIILTARDLVRVVPSAWQNAVKSGRRWTFDQYLQSLTSGDRDSAPYQHFWKRHDLAGITRRWVEVVGPERFHLVTVPPSGAPTDELWKRFASVLAIDPAAFDTQSGTSLNQSLSQTEAALMLRINRALPPGSKEGGLVRGLFANRLVRGSGGAKVALPAPAAQWAVERSSAVVNELRDIGMHVVGSLADLAPALPAEVPTELSDVPTSELAASAVRTVVALVEDLAKRDAAEVGEDDPGVDVLDLIDAFDAVERLVDNA